jgi:hypothetical protein
MTNRKISQALRTVPPVVWVLITLAAVVAAGTFAQSAHGLVGFGTDRMRLPVGFALLNPVCVDVLSVSAMVAAYVLRRAPWHVRVYGWLIFWLTLVLSVAGNEAQAYARLLPDDGRFGAAAPPLLLAAAVHLAVVVARHYDRDTRPELAASSDVQRPAASSSGRPDDPTAEPEPVEQDEPDTEPEPEPVEPSGPAPVIEPTHRRTRTRPAGTPDRRRTRNREPDPRRHDAARRVVVGGEGVNAVARDLDVSSAAVSRWARQARNGSLPLADLHLVDAGAQE